MRILFLGSGPFGIPTLQKLHSLGEELIVTTVPDAARGRRRTLQPSPIKEQALALGLQVLESERLRGQQGQQILQQASADLVITCDIRLILGARFLQGPELGCFNLHGSLLPRWRGAAPVVRALLAGDQELGVTLYRMVPALDAGPVVSASSWTPPATVTTEQAEQHLSQLAADLLEQSLELLKRGDAPQTPQQEDLVTLAPRVEKSEGWIHWQGSSSFIERQVRALQPWPRARTRVARQSNGTDRPEELILHQVSLVDHESDAAAGTVIDVSSDRLIVACGEGALSIDRVQRSGKKPMTMADLLRGMPLVAGDRFESGEVA